MTAAHYLPLGDLLATHEPAYCESWQEWFQACEAQPLLRAAVEELAQELEAAGSFEEPVRLSPEAWEEGEHFPARVANGMHRIAAHHCLGGALPVLVSQDLPRECLPPEEADLHLALFLESPREGDPWEAGVAEGLTWRHRPPQGESQWLSVEGGVGRDLLHLAGPRLLAVHLPTCLAEVEEKLRAAGLPFTARGLELRRWRGEDLPGEADELLERFPPEP